MARIPSPLLRTLLLLTLVVGFIAIGAQLRASLGIDLEVESVRQFAEGLGPLAPLLFIGVVAVRGFLALPSQVVLIAAGLCFGTVTGAIVGAIGLMISGFAIFMGTRYAGQESVEAHVGKRFRGLLEASQGRGAALFVALGSGYPISPLTPIHAAAGLSLLPIPLFLMGALAGGLIRSSIFSYFGNAIIEEGLSGMVLPLVALAAVLLIPLLFPAGRLWLSRIFGRAAEPPSSPGPGA